MTTDLFSCIKIFEALTKLSDTPLDYASAHAAVLAKSELAPHVEFFAGEERKLLERFGGEPDETGSFTIPRDKIPEFSKEREQLNGVEVDLTKRKLKTVPESITPAMLEALMIIFDFPEEVETNG